MFHSETMVYQGSLCYRGTEWLCAISFWQLELYWWWMWTVCLVWNYSDRELWKKSLVRWKVKTVWSDDRCKTVRSSLLLTELVNWSYQTVFHISSDQSHITAIMNLGLIWVKRELVRWKVKNSLKGETSWKSSSLYWPSPPIPILKYRAEIRANLRESWIVGDQLVTNLRSNSDNHTHIWCDSENQSIADR
jgi:hypothetical protein